MKHKLLLVFPLLWLSCSEAPTARPDAFMRIGLPSTDNYARLNESAPFGLDVNAEAEVIVKDVLAEEGNEEVREGEYWLDVVYPSILSTVQFTYKPVDNNLEALVRDAQQLAYKHTVKASGMREQFFEYKDKKVYGLYYELSGASATTTQFYATDSTQHFLRGVLYHYSAPNADSLAPVTQFMQAEILEMISSLHWNNAP
ncbi:MAG: hypothetical protein PVK00_03190 [Flavobacteriales bacterium]|jgi:gliding motility-associated lipoprotein GldD